jgi:major intracellular serine protease
MVKLIPYYKSNDSKIVNNTLINWGLEAIQVKKLWDENIYGEGSIIAVIDTGCDTNHVSLSNNIIGGANFSADYSSRFDIYEDNNGHGTHVAGIIAANNLNSNIQIGVAPKAKLLILKALKGDGSGSIDSLVRALYYAASWRGQNNEKVDIISLSLGTPEDSPDLKEAVQFVVSKNISIVAASGNDGDGTTKEEYRFPGAYNEVIEVGAIDENFQPAYFSNNNSELDLVAPGTNILSTFINNRYKTLSGTSMAAPFIAGVLALLKEKSRILFEREPTEPEIYAQLIKSTKLTGSPKLIGNGVLDLNKSFK